jgi:hypothetical protein
MSFFDKHKHSIFNNKQDDFMIPVNPIDLLNFKLKNGIQLQTGGSNIQHINENIKQRAIYKNKEFIKSCKTINNNNNIIVKHSCYKISGFNIEA